MATVSVPGPASESAHRTSGPRRFRRSGHGTWALLLVALPVLAVLLFVIFRPILVLPRIGPAPGFVLIDAQGHQVSHEDFRGKVTVYTVATTTCTDDCAETYALLHRLAELARQESWPAPVELVTVYLDQATPEQLRQVAAQVGVDPSHWRLLSGEPRTLKYMVGGGFELYYREDPEGRIEFEPGLVLVDGLGVLRAMYRGSLPSPEEVLRDLETLMAEIENSKGWARYAYEAAHLFLCYP